VLERVRAAILDHGPIGFHEFMEHALYGPGGFYERPRIGPHRDFVTAPHVHPIFGELLSAALMDLRDALGRPEPLRLVEVGAGDGTLARQLLGAFAEVRLDYVAVERSSGAREALARIAGVRVRESLRGLDAHVVLAHELLDNLPFRLVRGEREIRVGLDGDRPVPVDVPWDGPPGPPGGEMVVPVGAIGLIDDLAATLRRGYALVIDYGGVGDTGGAPHGYRAHRLVEDLLGDPGAADITSGVDFALLSDRARERGLTAFPSAAQRDVLVALGLTAWLEDERARQTELLAAGRGLEAVRTWGGRSRATLLADPAALGRHRWLLLATPGLPAPAWLGPASAEGLS
jgi:SAM-dependent MidA family methyltransferase